MTTVDNARNQAKAQLDSIREMLARLEHARECDGDPDTCELLNEPDCPFSLPTDTDADEFDEYHDEDCARAAIEEDPLSVEIRSGWHSPGEDLEPAEYMILLCTGGPAVRIIGDLDNGLASSARLEYQDWGTPWTEYVELGNSAVLKEYANHFLGY